MVLGVRVWFDETRTDAFQLAHTVNITKIGALLGGLRSSPRAGQTVLLQRGHHRMPFRVVWTRELGPGEIRAGIESLGAEPNIWGVELPEHDPIVYGNVGERTEGQQDQVAKWRPDISGQQPQEPAKKLSWGYFRPGRGAVVATLLLAASLALSIKQITPEIPEPALPGWMQARYTPTSRAPVVSRLRSSRARAFLHSSDSRLQVAEAPEGRLIFPLPPDPNLSGVVHLRIIISRNGRVKDVRLASGNPLLARAAVEAIKTWHYRRYEVRGQPVEAESNVTVRFVGDDAVLIRFAPKPPRMPSMPAKQV